MLVTKSTHVIISFQMTVETTTNAHALSTNSSKSPDAVEVSATTLLVRTKYGTFYYFRISVFEMVCDPVYLLPLWD